MDEELKKLLEIVKTGSLDEVRSAKKAIHEICLQDKKIRPSFDIFVEEAKKLDEIKDINHQAYFIESLKSPWFVMDGKDKEFWVVFILKYIQHPSGKIRQSLLSVVNNFIYSIEYFGVSGFRNYSRKEQEKIQHNRDFLCEFIFYVEGLIQKYYEPRFNRYKYLSSLPVSIYKSLQKLMVENLLRGEFKEKMYKDYLYRKKENYFKKDAYVGGTKPVKEVEDNIVNELNREGSSVSLENIKKIVYEMDSLNDAINKMLGFFKIEKYLESDMKRANEILECVMNAWNHFPHKSLGGLSPEEKSLELYGDQ